MHAVILIKAYHNSQQNYKELLKNLFPRIGSLLLDLLYKVIGVFVPKEHVGTMSPIEIDLPEP